MNGNYPPRTSSGPDHPSSPAYVAQHNQGRSLSGSVGWGGYGSAGRLPFPGSSHRMHASPQQHGGYSHMQHHGHMANNAPTLPPLASSPQHGLPTFPPPPTSTGTSFFSTAPLAASSSSSPPSHSPYQHQSASTSSSEVAAAQGRAYRSRKERPCDSCRRRKSRCIIEEAGQNCQSCRLNGRNCTFEMSPTPRSRPIKNEDGVTISSIIVPRKRSLSDVHAHAPPSPPRSAQQHGRHNTTTSFSAAEATNSGTFDADHTFTHGGGRAHAPQHHSDTHSHGRHSHILTDHLRSASDPENIVRGPDEARYPPPWPKPSALSTSSPYDKGADKLFNAQAIKRGIASSRGRTASSSRATTKELFGLISSMVYGRDNSLENVVESTRDRAHDRPDRGPEEERGMMPMAIGSSSSEDPMLLRQAGSPTQARTGLSPDGEQHASSSEAATMPPPQTSEANGAARRRHVAEPLAVASSSADRTSFGHLQVRQVASDPHHPIFFAFVPSHPYGRNRHRGHEIGAEGLAELTESLGSKIGALMVLYSQRDSAAFPLLTSTERRNFRRAAVTAMNACKEVDAASFDTKIPLDPVLANATLATATVYDHSLRPISRRAWGANLKALTEQFEISTLVTLQVALTDLTGRPSINTSGNFMSFCQTLAISHMLGLHLDCTGWNMPVEEKDVRIRLWWAILIHDKWSSLCWGRPSMVHRQDYTAPLPRRNSVSPCQAHLEDKDLAELPYGRGWACDQENAHTPGDTYVGLCRLTVILGDVLDEFHSVRPQQAAQRDAVATAQLIKYYFALLEDWMDLLPPTLASIIRGGDDGGRGAESIPGTRSLHLSYLGVNLLLCRAALDSVTKRLPQDPNRMVPAHRTALHGAVMLVEFLESLTDDDYTGFFLHYCSHHLASCLSLLGRLCFGFSQIGDETMLSTCVATIQRLLIVLSNAHRIHRWDLAELALTRSRAILPALETRIPDFPRFFAAESLGPSSLGKAHVGAEAGSPAAVPDSDAKPLYRHSSHASMRHEGANNSFDEGAADSSAFPSSRRNMPGELDEDSGKPGQPTEQHRGHESAQLYGILGAAGSAANARQHLPGSHPTEVHHFTAQQDRGGPIASNDYLTDIALGDGGNHNLDSGLFVFDGATGSITLDAAGVPFPLGMADEAQGPHAQRGGGAFIVDSATSGTGHLMSNVDFDWLMTAQSFANAAPPVTASLAASHLDSTQQQHSTGYGPAEHQAAPAANLDMNAGQGVGGGGAGHSSNTISSGNNNINYVGAAPADYARPFVPL